MAPLPVAYTDLMIVGAGPACMMAAAWASQYKMSTRIVDQNDDKTSRGKADALQARTLEIFDSFGVVNYVWTNGFHDIEMGIWGAIEQSLLDLVNQKFFVERSTTPERLELDHSLVEEEDAYPITLTLRHIKKEAKANASNGIASNEGNVADEGLEIVKAKYLVGADGAKSWTRKQLNIPLEGNQTDSVWGVMDIIPLTDFPDIRQSCAIHSPNYGSILNIPRESRLNRLYIQLNSDGNANNFNREQVTPESMLAMAQKILSPYKIDFRYCDWWSIYQIGQRIAPSFSVGNRIFLAGDAVHTHSPKLGQGMNVSMQDSYNLGWKLGSVITGRSPRTLLTSYEDERRKVALQLLAIDEEIARFYARDKAKVVTSDDHDFGAIRERMYDFLSGAGVTYGASQIVNSKSWQDLAYGVRLGARLPSHQVLNQADAWPTQLGNMLKSDGRWRIIVFAGDITDESQARRVQQLGQALAAPDSFLRRFTPHEEPIDSVIEVLTVHNAPHKAVDLLDLHEAFHPYDPERGWDYWKVFVNDVPHHVPFVDAYARYGIGTEGCLVVCRPDQHVGYIGALEDVAEIESYFSGILVSQS